MDDINKEKIRLALAILSGRVMAINISNKELGTLGYDHHRFSYYGSPTDLEIKQEAENIIFNALMKKEESDG